jgi:septum formation protein
MTDPGGIGDTPCSARAAYRYASVTVAEMLALVVVTRTLVLASASPARERLLRDAGLDPEVIISGVDESGYPEDDPHQLVEALATAKATAVAATLAGGGRVRHVGAGHRPMGADGQSLVLGCDSMLEFYGEVLGKPGTPAAAIERWHRMRGKNGRLLTGHCLIDVGNGAQATAVGETVVHFGEPTDAEIAAYVATGEPLQVAGAFTLDGRAAPFIESIDGDASNVIGLSLPLLRRLLAELGIGITELWRRAP